MQVKSVLLLLTACLSGQLMLGQQLDKYTPLTAEGRIPNEFLSTSTHKYIDQSKQISKKDKKYLKKAQRDFYLQSNFAADELLLSGRVLFNDTLSRYIQKIANVLLKNEPELRKNLKFYVLKSPIPNAFTTHRGTILINLGLMARLKHEAQLAYILSHEIAHFTQEHVLKRFINDRETQRKWKQSEPGFIGTKLILPGDYTRDSESEADLAGLDRMLTTSYNYSEIIEVFDILNSADKPYKPLTVDNHLLANTYIDTQHINSWNNQLTRSLTPKSGLSPKEKAEEELQTYLTTHPDPMWRKDLIQKRLPSESSKRNFVVSEEGFGYLKSLAEYELCNLYLNQAAYIDALYQTLTLKENPTTDPAFVDLAFSKTLYGIAKYKTAGKNIHQLLDYQHHITYSSYIERFVRDLSPFQAVLLAFTQAWETRQAYPNQPYYEAVIKDLLKDLYEMMPPLSEIKEQKTPETSVLYNLFQEEEFQLLYENILFEGNHQPVTPIPSKKKKKAKPTYHLGIDKVVVFNPRYSRIDQRPGQKGTQHLVSERHQGRFDSYILSSGQDLDLEVVLLDTRFMAPESDAKTFNDIALLSEWHHEKIIHENVDMITSNYDRLLPLIDKYQTPYFVHMGAISMRSPIEMGPRLKWLALLVAPPLWPYGIYEMVKPREASMFYSLVYNLKQDYRVATMSEVFNNRMQDKDLYDRIFQDLKQIKSRQ